MDLGNLNAVIANMGKVDNNSNVNGDNSVKTENKSSNGNFKSVMSSKEDSLSKTTEDNKTTVENVSKDINEAIDKTEVIEKIENGTKEEIIEEVMVLLQALNIPVIDNSNLPIKIYLESGNTSSLEFGNTSSLECINTLKNINYLSEIADLNISSEPINNNNSNVLENINLLKNNTVFESENINIFENVIEEVSLNNSENIDLNEETLSNIINLPIKEIVKTLNLEEDKVVTTDNIDKILTVLCDKDGNEIKKDKFIEVVDSSKGESKKDTSQGVEMLKMVFNIDKSNGEQKGEEDILAKLMTMDEDINKVEDYIVEDTPIFTEVLNSKNDVASSLISEVKPVAVSRETVATDVVSNVKYMVKNQVEQLTVKIYPKELGEITIKIISEDGIMKADIKSTSKETYTLLNSNMEEIKKHLSNESLIIKEVNIGLYEDTTYYSGQGFSNEFNDERNKENYSVEDNDSINIHKEENEEISEEISNVNLLA
ncbi:flagellar hook-length control protein FliK [Clostridium sp. CAG:265]|uniref:flagellar hook-length control protein FliK n=1 Tax=Clostridium sp. CAG:265 TaxID=1262787 RepID=UPI0003367568|nr:flagellar hook-length control protein FliK [Clostridium sp. CAG:265]CDB75709.1 flagellar hook-length control protein [Clostridium sp. CAG:265]